MSDRLTFSKEDFEGFDQLVSYFDNEELNVRRMSGEQQASFKKLYDSIYEKLRDVIQNEYPSLFTRFQTKYETILRGKKGYKGKIKFLKEYIK